MTIGWLSIAKGGNSTSSEEVGVGWKYGLRIEQWNIGCMRDCSGSFNL